MAPVGPARVGHDRGSATAELAVVLPGLILLTALCVWAVLAVALHVQCVDAARSGARALARGEPVAAAVAVAVARGPEGAEVRVHHLDGGLVAVEVRARAGLPGRWAHAPAPTVGGRVVAAAEGDP